MLPRCRKILYWGGAGQTKMMPKITSRNQGSELSNATMIPQMTVVVDLICSTDELSLAPDDAVLDCHACRLPSVLLGHKRL